MFEIKNIYVGLLSIALMMLASCSDFLEPKATSEYTPKDPSSLSELLLGNAYPTPDDNISMYVQTMDDDVSGAPYQATVDYNINGLLGIYTWQPKMYEWLEDADEKAKSDLYYNCYSKILGANAVYEQAVKIENEEDTTALDMDLLHYVKAQALTLRAFFFLHLTNVFCMPYNEYPTSMGVPLKVTSAVEEHNLSRPTVAEDYDQIVSDLLEAIEVYKKLTSSYQWSKNFRTSLPLAQLLLSRTYLYMENWKEAADYAQLVMANKNFALTNYNSLDTTRNYNFHAYEVDGMNNENIWLYGNLVSDCTYWVNLYKFGKESRPFLQASDELMACFDEMPGDLRKQLYTIDIPYTTVDGTEKEMKAAFGKVNTYTTAGKEWMPTRVVSQNTFARSFRLSEAYLNYCEAMANLYLQGDAEAGKNALKVLNNFRSYRYAYEDYENVSFANAQDMLEFIHRERRREFCFEDMRWFDLRRWGMPEIKHVWYPDANTKTVYTLGKGDPQYCFPLPPDAIELNSLLKQNDLLSGERNGVNGPNN